MTEITKNNELFEKLMHLQWLLHRQKQQELAGHGPFADPTRGQGRVLAVLKLQPEISTKDLSYVLGIRQQSLSELLNKLEKAGYVTRFPLETDKRVMVVKLTEKGETAQQSPPDNSDIFDCLTSEEQANFSDYLSRIISAVEAQLSDEEKENMERWKEQARSRMGDDTFDYLMSMGGRGFHNHGHGRHGEHGPHEHHPEPPHEHRHHEHHPEPPHEHCHEHHPERP